MKKLYATLFSALVVGCAVCAGCTTKKVSSSAEVVDIIHKVNGYWQTNHPEHGRSFWDNAAYHTGNMEAYFLTNKPEYLEYSKGWAEHNEWKGAKSDHKANWKYSYGESNDYVLFGDYQICFQTYADLYNLEPDTHKIARAREVMEYQMSTPNNDYWWWADGLYMVMPVMTKLYNITKNPLYLEKLHEYLAYADSIMYDEEAGLYYRDGKYVYPKHKSVNGKKDFWARGDGWVLAGLAKVLKDLPETEPVTEPVEESPEATAGTETTEETESAAEDDKESDKETKGRNSFFGKKKKDNKLEQQIEDLTDRLKRNMAEFDNFRKRTEKEKSSMYVIGAKDIIEKILPVVDNFERGLAQAPEDDPFAEGMQKIYKQFTTTMEGMGVEPIEAVGKEFNPDFHNAVMHVEDEAVGENIVVEELQKGYTYKGFVVRHSMVKVAN